MRLVVVGGGIAGLAAASRLRTLAGDDAEIILLEASDQLGGKIRTDQLLGLVAEAGAETFLMRERGVESAALTLARSVGLGDDLVHPAMLPAAVAVGGVMHPIPAGTLLGVPADPSTVEGFAAVAGADLDAGHPLLGPTEDIAVGKLVRARYGDQIVDRLVDPMLGGVYAGSADGLSLAATLPAVHAAAQAHPTLAAAVSAAMSGAPRPTGSPIFATVRGGLGRLIDAVAASARAQVRLETTARGLTRTPSGWRLLADEVINADAVILAVPARSASQLLSGVDTAAAAAVGVVDYANVALVTLALPPDTTLPAMSGFLVPAVEGYAVKAATFFTVKWPHLRGDNDSPVLLRASFGRYGDAGIVRRPDAELVALAHQEVGALLGVDLPTPVASAVSRWERSLPQYGVGHVTRVADVRRQLPATLTLAGAAYDGVGIAACVRSGQAAADAAWAAVVSGAPNTGGLEESWA